MQAPDRSARDCRRRATRRSQRAGARGSAAGPAGSQRRRPLGRFSQAAGHNQTMDPPAALAEQLRSAVSDERVLAAIEALPREQFVPEAERARAWENVALPIDCEQTISQPLVVA